MWAEQAIYSIKHDIKINFVVCADADDKKTINSGKAEQIKTKEQQ